MKMTNRKVMRTSFGLYLLENIEKQKILLGKISEQVLIEAEKLKCSESTWMLASFSFLWDPRYLARDPENYEKTEDGEDSLGLVNEEVGDDKMLKVKKSKKKCDHSKRKARKKFEGRKLPTATDVEISERISRKVEGLEFSW